MTSPSISGAGGAGRSFEAKESTLVGPARWRQRSLRSATSASSLSTSESSAAPSLRPAPARAARAASRVTVSTSGKARRHRAHGRARSITKSRSGSGSGLIVFLAPQLAVAAIIGPHDLRHERVANDVDIGEMDERDAAFTLERLERVGEAGARLRR